MIASSATEWIEISFFDSSFNQPFSCWTVCWEWTSWRNVVGRNWIPEFQQNASIFDAGYGLRLWRKAREECWKTDIRWVCLPRVKWTWFWRNAVPTGFVHSISISLPKHFRSDDIHCLTKLFFARPDIRQHNRFSIGGKTDRFCSKVDLKIACQSVRNNERRTCKIGCLDFPMYSSLKISITRYDRANYETCLINCCINFLREWSRITDASCAPVTNNIEPKCIEVVLKSCCFIVFGDDPAPRG